MRFSVIIPNRNNCKYVRKCLESVLNQTFKDFEIIFIDDMSDDGSEQIARELLRPQDTFLENTTRRMNGGSRNEGIVRATGEYTICIDSDDWLIDDHVFEDIDRHIKGEDIVFLDYQLYGPNKIEARFDYQSLEQARTDATCAIWAKVVRTSLLKQVLFPEGNLFEDRIQHYRLCTKARTFSCLKRITHVWNRMNLNSTSKNDDVYNAYRFHYCGELYIFAKELKNDEFKQHLKKEIYSYLEVINKQMEEL